MPIIGCDYHPSFQQIAFVDTDTGELSERRLAHREQAAQFYWERKQRHLAMRRGRKIAKVAMARKLAVHLSLDVASGLRLRPIAEARFVRGRTRTSRCCTVHHRCNDWASRSLIVREFE